MNVIDRRAIDERCEPVAETDAIDLLAVEAIRGGDAVFAARRDVRPEVAGALQAADAAVHRQGPGGHCAREHIVVGLRAVVVGRVLGEAITRVAARGAAVE